jgi:predicted helicase
VAKCHNLFFYLCVAYEQEKQLNDMSKQAIQQYYTKTDRIIQFGGTSKETSIRNEFSYLLSQYADNQNLALIPELTIKGANGANIRPDGTLKNVLRLDFGYWESKDSNDDLEEEINKKIAKGYPQNNILFEDSKNAILIQNSVRVGKAAMRNSEELHALLHQFVTYKSEIVDDFNKAIEQFKTDVPVILKTLRAKIDSASLDNQAFIRAKDTFLDLCRSEINPDISDEDVREMMIQHILSENIFNVIFHDSDFHRENNIAKSIEDVLGTFFDRAERKNTLEGIRHYYETIERNASNIADHHEKQRFLKVVYENFYKAYNPKGADKLGIVYTPGEIVQFMLESTDYLLEKHFNRNLADKNVEILDPATGTGTFICDLIDYLPPSSLKHKFKNEIYANEIAILPYYIANLNIEYTFKQKMGFYEEFPNLCFVDTLDNINGLAENLGGLHSKYMKTGDLFGLNTQNKERINRQNARKISVIIGNPPYNANQQNENDNNKNREYGLVDKRIKDTFIKNSTAQKTKVYDMYARFFRWAMDRLSDEGIIAFITNRSFIDSRTFDGFRQSIQEEFDHIYVVDTKSDVRANPKISGTKHNVFGIQTGVAILFLVKCKAKK